MNYEKKLDSMFQKGILNEKQMKDFKRTLIKKKDTKKLEKRNNFLYLSVGFVLVALFVFISIFSSSDTVEVQNVASVLNSGDIGYVSGSNTLLFVGLFAAFCFLGIFYVMSLMSYNKIVKLLESVREGKVKIDNAGLYRENILNILSYLITKITQHEKKIYLNSNKDIDSFISSFPELKSNVNFLFLHEEMINALIYEENVKIDTNASIKLYNVALSVFPNSLAKLLGKFESVEYFETNKLNSKD